MPKFIRIVSALLFLGAVAFLVAYPHEDTSGARIISTPPVTDEPTTAAIASPPAMEKRDWAPLKNAIAAELHWFPGSLSVVAEDLVTGERFTYNADEEYHPASTMKVAVALCIARAVRRGDLTWTTPLALTADDYDPEENTEMDEMPPGTEYTVQDLVGRSLAISSNVATHMLIRNLGLGQLLTCSTDLGGPVTRVDGRSTPVSATDVAAWWERLWELKATAPADAAVILQALRSTDYTERIAAGTPAPERVTHKFGSVDDYFHDSAIIWTDRPYLLVIMTGGAGEGEANWVMEHLAAAAWKTAK